MRPSSGRAGCGCLFFGLVALIIFLGIFLHPASLRFFGKLLTYSDKPQFTDITFVPRVEEDTQGEIYLWALEELRKGNSKALFVEEFSFLDLNISEILARVARERGIKNSPIFGIKLEGDLFQKATKLKDLCLKKGIKKVTIFVPEYSSRRYALVFRNLQSGDINFLIKAVNLHTFNSERWWKDSLSRVLFLREISGILGLEAGRIKEIVLKRVSSKGG